MINGILYILYVHHPQGMQEKCMHRTHARYGRSNLQLVVCWSSPSL